MVSNPDTLQNHAAFLKQIKSTARIGPWKLYPGLAKIKVSSEWVELFAVAKPPTRFQEYLTLIDSDDRKHISREVLETFLMGKAKHWESTFQRSGRVILARAVAISPGRVIGVDIDIT